MANTPQKFKTKIQADAGVQITTEAPSRALQLDASGNAQSSAVTSTELAYVSGVTGPIQGQLDLGASEAAAAQADATQALADAAAAQSAADAAQADIDAHIADAVGAHAASAISNTPSGNLAATDVQSALNELQTELDGVAAISADVADLVTLSGRPANSVDLGSFTGSIIPDASTVKAALQSLETEIEALPDPIYYAGTYNASTNTPTLANTDVGMEGALYQVTVAGSQDFGAGSISFEIGDKVVNNGTIWEKWDHTDAVMSVNGQSGVVVLDSDDIAEGSTNLYYTAERAQDDVAGMLQDSNTIDVTYNDATPSVVFDVKTQMSVTSDASGVKLVNDEASPTATKYYGTDGSGVKGYHAIPAVGSPGDIQETSFSMSNNVASPADVTGLAFANATVRSFEAQVSIAVSATANLFEVYTLKGIQKGFNWDISVQSVGDESGVVFSITNAGQVQYTNISHVGFTAQVCKFRAATTSV